MRFTRVQKSVLAAVAACALGSFSDVATASARGGTGLVYAVVDRDGSNDGGVLYRDSPRWNDSRRITGVGGYYGEKVELVCGAWGEAVGPASNRRWHLVDNVSRPAAGRGWLPDRYLSTPNKANELTPGEPECGATAQTPADGLIGSVYFQPRNGKDDPIAPSEALTLPLASWSAGGCDDSRGDDFPDVGGERPVKRLGAWSVGRLGPIYLLSENFEKAKGIDTMVFFDPGSYQDFYDKGGFPNRKASCDRRYDETTLLRRWLDLGPHKRILVLAGAVTRDAKHKRNGRAHAGIQHKWFPKIRGSAVAKQVLVCNYDDMGHPDVLRNFAWLMTRGSVTSCPADPDASWHP